jgi:hypothetical protein
LNCSGWTEAGRRAEKIANEWEPRMRLFSFWIVLETQGPSASFGWRLTALGMTEVDDRREVGGKYAANFLPNGTCETRRVCLASKVKVGLRGW